jgi:hypothetical protein
LPTKHQTAGSATAVGLHPLGHAELADNGQSCGTCGFALPVSERSMIACSLPTLDLPLTRREWRACARYLPRSKNDYAHQLYRPEEHH